MKNAMKESSKVEVKTALADEGSPVYGEVASEDEEEEVEEWVLFLQTIHCAKNRGKCFSFGHPPG